MAEPVRVEVRGFAELAAGTRTLAERIDRTAVQSFAGVAGQVAGRVAAAVPRATGATASSAGIYQSGDAVGPTYGAGVRAARFVEYGGRGHAYSDTGNYLYPAAQEAEAALVAAGEQAARREIGAMTWPSP